MDEDKRLTAQELISSAGASRQILPAPDSFSGTIEELTTTHARHNLLAPEQVVRFHQLLLEYFENRDPLFLIRAIGQTSRGQIYHTNSGNRFKATDNAPAWWVHYALFQEIEIRTSSFAPLIETLPTHFFEIAAQVPRSISSAGWHVAHIFAVKDRKTEYAAWDRKELVRRCVRNIHPCNYFFIPKTDWQLWGGNERVISYFAQLFESLYGAIWKEFLSLAGVDYGSLVRISGTIAYQIRPRAANENSLKCAPARSENAFDPTHGAIAIEYRSTRLTFRADLIEPLSPKVRFRIVTPAGTFVMSKAEFYSSFPNVVASKSYQRNGLYHYPKIPAAALRFRVGS
jgi:hypothetical protein